MDSKLWQEAYEASQRVLSPSIQRHGQVIKKRAKKPYKQPKDEIRLQIDKIDSEIRQLRFKRAVLLSELRAKKNKNLANRKLKLYALELQDGCYYVGSSWNPDKRFRKHLNGKGAKWTQLHKPIRIIEVIDTDSVFQDDVALKEDELTIQYAETYGTEYVRGGGYCQVKYVRWPDHLR